MKKIFLALITLLAGIGITSAQCTPVPTSSSNVVLTQRVVKVGMLNGVFSVAANKKVAFSKGNLQYQGSTGTWRFAENQWDYIGNAVGNTTAALADRASNVHWVDLFGWGTSGYNNKYPYMISTTEGDYPSSSIANTDYDWGKYNAGQLGSGWFTLSSTEWDYLIKTRRNADNAYLYAMGVVHGKNGLIILPDGWRQANSAMAGTLTLGTSSWSNNLSDDNWAALEKEGAVFLPAAGYRLGTSVNQSGSEGYYWSSTYNNPYGYYLELKSSVLNPTRIYYYRYYGFSVRLVQVVP